jgi:hypothetical protein
VIDSCFRVSNSTKPNSSGERGSAAEQAASAILEILCVLEGTGKSDCFVESRTQYSVLRVARVLRPDVEIALHDNVKF